MKDTVFPHKFWRPFLDCMPQLFFRPQYVWFPIHLKGLLIPFWYETLVVNWQNWLFTLFHQSRSVLSPNPIGPLGTNFNEILIEIQEIRLRNGGHFVQGRWVNSWRVSDEDYAIIASDTALFPVWCQAIIWTNTDLMLLGPLGTSFSGGWLKMKQFLFKKIN